MLKEFRQDGLLCKVYETRKEMGAAAADDIYDKIMELLSEKEVVNMIFAAAPSQNEVLEALTKKLIFRGIELMHFIWMNI